MGLWFFPSPLEVKHAKVQGHLPSVILFLCVFGVFCDLVSPLGMCLHSLSIVIRRRKPRCPQFQRQVKHNAYNSGTAPSSWQKMSTQFYPPLPDVPLSAGGLDESPLASIACVWAEWRQALSIRRIQSRRQSSFQFRPLECLFLRRHWGTRLQ